MEKSQRKVICLTPVKNEAWILETFLKCASLWADYVIIADQNSDDESLKIASRFEKVIIVNNDFGPYDEQQRQQLLLNAARSLPFPRLLIALDADEFLTPNLDTSGEWQSVLNAPKGTIIKMPFAQIKPNMKHYWRTPDGVMGYMDDGYTHSGNVIHSPRVPIPANAPEINLKEIFVMHYQYVNWERMRSKHRWYQCWERINNPERSSIDIFRQYHHMFGIRNKELQEVPAWWFDGYSKYGIDMRHINKEECYWWDKEILREMEEYGAKQFAKESIWDVKWESIADQYRYENTLKFKDPRCFLEKMVHTFLLKTQPYSQAIGVRLIDYILKRRFGW